MPFKFKLSKRLALIKASLAASVVLALACERDLTDPQPPRNPLTQVITSADLTPLPVASVLASGDDGNLPQNTLANNLATRWSASGDGQWIRYDLGAVMAVGPVTIAWHRGTEWASAFDIEVSLDSLTWTRAFTGRSSGQTLQPERYDFPTVPGRYLRIVGHGQWSGTTQLSFWNSITETAIYGSAAATIKPVPVASVVASGDDGNVPQNTLDNNLATRWSASGDGQWIRYDLGAVTAVGPVTIAWYRGTEWASAFDIEVSLDSLTWTRVFTGRSSGQTLQPERYDFPTVPGRYVRIVGHGQWSGTTQLSLWNSITETAIYVSAAVRIDSVPVASVTVSPTSGSARIGATVQLTGVTKDSAGNLLTRRTVSWMTSNASVATVSAGGLVTGMTAGSATITGTSEGNRGTSTITVTNVPVARVTVTPAITSLLMGATLQLTATPTDALGNPLSGRVVTWSTNTPRVATVSGTGLVTGSGVGAVAITATSEGQSGSAAVTVTRVNDSTPLSSPTFPIPNGARRSMGRTAPPSRMTAITSRSSTSTSPEAVTKVSRPTAIIAGSSATASMTCPAPPSRGRSWAPAAITGLQAFRSSGMWWTTSAPGGRSTK